MSFDLATAETLRESLVYLDLDGGLDVRMDLTGLDFLDSSGISVVVSVCKRVRASGGTFAGVCDGGLVRRALEVTGLVEYLQLDEDRCQADVPESPALFIGVSDAPVFRASLTSAKHLPTARSGGTGMAWKEGHRGAAFRDLRRKGGPESD